MNNSGWTREWDSAARDVRTALAACAVQIVNERTDNGSHPHTAQITSQVWGDLCELLYAGTARQVS